MNQEGWRPGQTRRGIVRGLRRRAIMFDHEATFDFRLGLQDQSERGFAAADRLYYWANRIEEGWSPWES